MAATQSHSLQYRGINIRFEGGDVSRRGDDALAISCDLAMTLNSQLCASFVQKAGQQFQVAAIREVARYPQLYQYPPVPVAIRIPATGRLRTQNVILLPIGSTFVGLIPRVLTEMLNSAIQCGAQTLAFPTIGTGGFHLVDHYGFCQALFDAVTGIQNFGTLSTLTLVNTSDYWTDQYYLEIQTLIANSQQAIQQQPVVNPPSAQPPPLQNFSSIFGNYNATANLPNFAQNASLAHNAVNFAQFLQLAMNSLNAQAAPIAQNVPAVQNVMVASTSSATNTNQKAPFSSAFNKFDKKMAQELYRECLKERQNEKTSSSKTVEDDRIEACPVCLNDMLDDVDNYEEDGDTTIVQTIQCLHKFHIACLTEWFRNKPTCPVCSTPCMDIHGNQPINGFMTCFDASEDVDGYPGVGHIRINYDFPGGIQSAEHPNPGIPYSGTSRTCYLPNNAEGRKVRDMLRIAFNRRLIFTVGQSTTTGRHNVITWNGIHHKTSRHGGVARYGYPDPTYLQRVKEELATYGITESMLD